MLLLRPVCYPRVFRKGNLHQHAKGPGCNSWTAWPCTYFPQCHDTWRHSLSQRSNESRVKRVLSSNDITSSSSWVIIIGHHRSEGEEMRGVLILALMGLHCVLGHRPPSLAGILPPMRLRFESGEGTAQPTRHVEATFPGRGEFAGPSKKFPKPYLNPSLTYRAKEEARQEKTVKDRESERSNGMRFEENGFIFEWETPSQDEIARRLRWRPRWGYFLADTADAQPVNEWWEAPIPAVELWKGLFTVLEFWGHLNVERARVYLTHVMGGNVDELRPLPRVEWKESARREGGHDLQQAMRRAKGPYVWWDAVEGWAMRLRGGGSAPRAMPAGAGAFDDVLHGGVAGKKEQGWPFFLEWDGSPEEFRKQCADIISKAELPPRRSIDDPDHTPDDRPLWGSRGTYFEEEMEAKYQSFGWWARFCHKMETIPAYRRRVKQAQALMPGREFDLSSLEEDSGEVPGTFQDDWDVLKPNAPEEEDGVGHWWGGEAKEDELPGDFLDKLNIRGPDGKESAVVAPMRTLMNLDLKADDFIAPELRDLKNEKKVMMAVMKSIREQEDTRPAGTDSLKLRSMKAESVDVGPVTAQDKARKRDIQEAMSLIQQAAQEEKEDKMRLAVRMMDLIEPVKGEGEYAGFSREESEGYARAYSMRFMESQLWAEMCFGGDKERALWQAASLGMRQPMILAIEAGADVNAMDGWGRTALHHTVYLGMGNGTCVSALLKYGADKNAQDDSGWTPLCRAVFWGHYNSAVRLLDAGADMELETKGLRRALHWGAATGQVECVRLLCSRGAQLLKRDEDGMTAHEIAVKKEFNKTAGILKRAWNAEKKVLIAERHKWVQEVAYNGTELEGMDDLPEAPDPCETDVTRFKQWFYDDMMRTGKEVEKEIFVEAGLNVSYVDRQDTNFGNLTQKGWTRMMDKMRSHEQLEATKAEKKRSRIAAIDAKLAAKEARIIGDANKAKHRGDRRMIAAPPAERKVAHAKGKKGHEPTKNLMKGKKIKDGKEKSNKDVLDGEESEDDWDWWMNPMFKEYWSMNPICPAQRLRRPPIYMNSTEWQETAWNPSMRKTREAEPDAPDPEVM